MNSRKIPLYCHAVHSGKLGIFFIRNNKLASEIACHSETTQWLVRKMSEAAASTVLLWSVSDMCINSSGWVDHGYVLVFESV